MTCYALKHQVANPRVCVGERKKDIVMSLQEYNL